MTREAFICAIAIALMGLLLCVRESRGQTFAELLAAAAECPEAMPCPPPKAMRTTLQLPSDALPGDRYEVTAGTGYSPSAREACVWARARAIRGDEESPTAEIAQPPDCIPVPEPPVWMGMLAGVGAVYCLSASRRRRNARA